MEKQEHKPDDHGSSGGNPVVEVKYLNSNAVEKFHASWDDTLAQVWERAYAELEEARAPAHQLECQDGHSLMSHLNLTLAQMRDQHICQNRKFQIRSATGGAF